MPALQPSRTTTSAVGSSRTRRARGAARLARALYDEQFTSYLDVLDAERSLFEAELEQSLLGAQGVVVDGDAMMIAIATDHRQIVVLRTRMKAQPQPEPV